ncbi:hypothetical protein HGH93_29685 [Chitinophaga polysaccharea]|uniref:hypothetical protein n=1 Tax=Chitinophaga polysaccharea TaxID=1293035 RepID=UPI001455B719|nr:hypothetical protein [Chitinophaga polysaccharea]NLR62300.1 hypothetical protein [Chitinophaga polysaccharea]
MKFAKIALSAVAVLAVIGGAVAYKANSAQTLVYIQEAGKANCTLPVTTPYVTDNPNTIIKASLTTVSGACPTLSVRFDG